MKISIITVFPELHQTFINTSLIKKAQEKDLISFDLIRLADFCSPKGRIDEPSAGPGAGMILKPQILELAIESVIKKHGEGFKIFFSPQGTTLNQNLLKTLVNKFSHNDESLEEIYNDDDKSIAKSNRLNHLILICARYEGIDARVESFYADAMISIGDLVLMGGDVAAQVFLEGFLRLIPNIIGKKESVENESFSGPFLDYPEFGLPIEWKGMQIPKIVLSGNHAEIQKWRDEQKVEKTILNRFDWFRSANLQEIDIKLAKKHIPPHYAILMHNDIYVKDRDIGHTSITSMDIHDIARSSATYDLKNYFIVSELADQQTILNTFLGFWKSEKGMEYNRSRYEAMKRVISLKTFSEAIKAIEEKEGKKPIIIATSAKTKSDSKQIIDYYSQGKVWKHKRPVVFIFGTGQGLCDEIIDKCDYLLLPILGMSNYNHLSVRSAAAIIFDRWFGLNQKLH